MIDRDRLFPPIAVLLALLQAVSGPGCEGDDADDDTDTSEEYVSSSRQDLDDLIEAGLAYEMPPPLSQEEVELLELKQYRLQVAEDMADEARAAMVPLVVAASLFAVEGPVDLLLAVMPVHKIGKVGELATDAFKAARKKRKARLAESAGKFLDSLDDEARDFLRLADNLARADRRALKVIYKHTGSTRVVTVLMRKHLEHEADVRWIAQMLKRKKLDDDFVRRFEFDAGLVERMTNHESHPSWITLQRVLERKPVSQNARNELVAKVYGLLGEQAAEEYVQRPAFTTRYFGSKHHPIEVGRGVGYERRGSLDLVVHEGETRTLFVEVKNWSDISWGMKSAREDVLAQLARHNRGGAQVAAEARRQPVAKVLVVSRKGYQALERAKPEDFNAFKSAVEALGWRIEEMPTEDLESFDSFIDQLRRGK